MDHVECPRCRRFYSSTEGHTCPAEGQSSESSIPAEETEKINFHKIASDVQNDSSSTSHQETSKRKLEQSSPTIIRKLKKSSDSAEENVASSSSHAASDTQCPLSDLNSDCPDGTVLPEVKESVEVPRFAQNPTLYLVLEQDHPVSSDADTVDAANTPVLLSSPQYVCYYCAVCGRCFPTSGKLKSHIGIHTGEKKFECSECGRGFSLKQYHDNHVQCNVGQDPSICNGCGASFTFKCALESHYCTVYGNKIIKCHLCKKAFSTQAGLINHMRTYH